MINWKISKDLEEAEYRPNFQQRMPESRRPELVFGVLQAGQLRSIQYFFDI